VAFEPLDVSGQSVKTTAKRGFHPLKLSGERNEASAFSTTSA
jgi:hypothetical protein